MVGHGGRVRVLPHERRVSGEHVVSACGDDRLVPGRHPAVDQRPHRGGHHRPSRTHAHHEREPAVSQPLPSGRKRCLWKGPRRGGCPTNGPHLAWPRPRLFLRSLAWRRDLKWRSSRQIRFCSERLGRSSSAKTERSTTKRVPLRTPPTESMRCWPRPHASAMSDSNAPRESRTKTVRCSREHRLRTAPLGKTRLDTMQEAPGYSP